MRPTTRAGRAAKAALTKSAQAATERGIAATADTLPHDPVKEARKQELRDAIRRNESDQDSARNASSWNAVSSLQHAHVKYVNELSKLEGISTRLPDAPKARKDHGAEPRFEVIQFGEPADPCEYCGHQQGPGGCNHGQAVRPGYSAPVVVAELPHDRAASDGLVEAQRAIPALQRGTSDV